MKSTLHDHPHRLAVFLLLSWLLAAVLSGCVRTAETQIPLPTARVPSLFEVNSAIDLWKNSGNENYFITVEETDETGTFLYRIVLRDGGVHAAQRLEQVVGVWQQPVAIEPAEAERYTVDALLDRVLADVNGDGAAPLNMFVVFDNISGYPTLVDAKAIPSYTEDGRIRLNREHSYVLSVTVDVLLEDSFGLSKTPLLTLTRSGGEAAACSTLRIFTDGSSIYSDNCRQILLQLRPPEDDFARLETLAAELPATVQTRQSGSQSQEFILHGTGDGTTDPETAAEIWDLAVSLDTLLSRPIGEGITLLIRKGDAVAGFDLRTNLEQPATLDLDPPLHGGLVDRTGRLLVYSDGSGLKWLDAASGETGTYIANTGSQWVVPVAVTGDGRVVLNRYSLGTDTPEWGWISPDDRTWHPIAEIGGCITGAAASPLDGRLAVTAAGGAGCEAGAVVWILDLEAGTAEPIVSDFTGAWHPAWSTDGSRLAFSAAQGDPDDPETPTQLQLVYPDGSDRTALTGHEAGRVTGLAWGGDDALVYGLAGTGGDAADGLFEVVPSTGEIVRSLEGEDLAPISFDATGEFLAFSDGSDLLVWVVSFGQVQSAARGAGADAFIGFVGAPE